MGDAVEASELEGGGEGLVGRQQVIESLWGSGVLAHNSPALLGMVMAIGLVVDAKKSLPLSSTTMKAGKSSTSIFQTASMPSSGYSRTSTLLMQSWARRAAGPPIEPR